MATGKTIPVAIEDEIKVSYLNYAMSVIVARALPDARDGLKPVHRRILYAMSEMGLRSDRPFKKAARIVGDVLGKFHPHGDLSVYDALVRLAQDFSLRYPAVQGQGNFGSVDGDPPAAQRYTEARMTSISEEMLRDIRKETVDFGPNYDDSMTEPKVLPGAFPFLLANGGSGIAVGMATNIPPQNLREIGDAIIAYIDNPDVTVDDLIKKIPGPDFPTGGIIYGKAGIAEAYKTGRGKITVRSKCVLETTAKGRDVIIVTEIPYAVNKSTLIMRIADLVREKKIDGITDLNDESDRDGMRIVIELKKSISPRVVLNQLYSHTQLQQNFSVNFLALVDGKPKLLDLKEAITCFVEHRQEVVTRRSRYDLRKAEERAHILEGLKIALQNIDEVVEIIKASDNVDVARTGLMKRFSLSEAQAQAILNMRLQRLTSLETQKILDELKEIEALIAYLNDLLSSEKKILNVVKDETLEIVKKYGDERRTQIVPDEIEAIDDEDLIQKEDMVIVMSNRGFIKRVPVSAYRSQGRGGRGASSATLKNDDFIENLFVASTHDHFLFISSLGKAYWMKVHEIPEVGRAARGQHIKALLSIGADEDITTVLPLAEFSEETFIFMATARGVVKKANTAAFTNARTRGIIAIKLDANDRLISAHLTTGSDEVVLVTRGGSALRFNEDHVRSMGRSTRGVRGVRLSNVDELVGALCVRDDEQMLLLSENGYGKRIEYSNFTPHGRGTGGQMAYKVSEKTGELAGVVAVTKQDELVCITSQGNAVKLKLKEVPALGKSAQGVRIVNIRPPDFVVGMARVVAE
ncbi:MAG: DNA gyrase subunit A [Spirochaetales bacterium]|nr:DNA gyrase subunit A [Spirochaetales bacterium]